ncbi:MAG: fungal-specific transcription factor domain-containing protein [Lentinula lateritia]|uniref:Fungal-specific transcription factor domain-containing protein n=1 Tax=Lentinula lateritia TaxID=40482 RepID=A0ABQ8VI23_9AGAR|nr:MAG: fungal-specific transcription factor domain-containing protein [Lentinula lateritia]KAJ4495284.1 fungal-specific transcription factor domain-containing protein [Lentinula lateritia]
MAHSEEDAQDEGVRPTKRRATQACQECRRRKVKCDNDATGGACSNCLNMKIECKQTMQKQKRGPKVGSRRRPASDVKYLVYKILAAPLSFAIPEESQTIREMLVDLATYARKLEHELDRLQPPPSASSASVQAGSSPVTHSSTSPSNHDSQSEDEFDVVQSLSARINRIGFGKFRQRHVSPASQLLLRAALDIRDEVNGAESRVMSSRQRRPEFWHPSPWHQCYEPEEPNYVFPEHDLMRQLVSLYFSNVHYLFPLLHQPTFENHVFVEKLHLSDSCFAATLLAVCSIGSRHSNDPRVLSDVSQLRSAGWKYFKQIRLSRASFIQPVSLFEVQLYALSTIFMQPSPVGEATSSLVGMGIRFAQEVGAHKRHPPGKTPQEKAERELWKRAYWVLVSLDFFSSSSTGRPRATTEKDIELEFLIECDDECWMNESDPESSFVQPPERPSYVEYWNHFLRLIFLFGDLHHIRSSESPPQETLMELAAGLDQWMDSMPSHLRWDPHNPNGIYFQQSMMLQGSYYWLQCAIHHPFVRPGPVSPLNFSSLAICTNAARSYVHLLDKYLQRPDSLMLPHMIPPAFISSVLLLVNIWKSTWMNSAMDPEKDIAQVYRCLEIMSMYEERYEMPGRFRDVLQAIISASRIPSLSRQQYSLKRTRGGDLQGIMLDAGHIIHVPSVVHPELPPESLSAFSAVPNAPFEPADQANHESIMPLSNYDQDDWNDFMMMVDDLLQTANPVF